MRVASPKRGAPERVGLGGWFPYYAGFSLDFAKDALRALEVGPTSVVLDPMVGSGTLAVAAQIQGTNFIGTDLNPVMAVTTAAKDGSNSQDATTIACNAIIEAASRDPHRSAQAPDFATTWYNPLVWSTLRSVIDVQEIDNAVKMHPRISELLDHRQFPLEPMGPSALARAAAVFVARAFAGVTHGSNPTWPRQTDRIRRQSATIQRSVCEKVKSMESDLRDTFGPANGGLRRIAIGRADSRNLPIPDSSIDAIVTSPPYLTRLDYVVATAPELALFDENANDRHALRGLLMGTTTTARADQVDLSNLPQGVTDILRKVAMHPSKESGGYYRKQFEQYFSDACALTCEIARVLRPGGTAILVLQDSWYKDIKVPLGELYLELFAEAGVPGKIIKSERILRHLTQFNSAAAQYPKGVPQEHVIRVTKT